MANWTALEWLTAIGIVGGLIGVLIAVLTYIRGRKAPPETPHTVNIAKNSRHVAQSGGDRTTRNEAEESENVDQRGG